MMRGLAPSLASHSARTRPVGPAPTISTTERAMSSSPVCRTPHHAALWAFDDDLTRRWCRALDEEFEIFPLRKRERNSQRGPLPLDPRHEDQVDGTAALVGIHCDDWRESIMSRIQFDHHGPSPVG